MSFQFEFSTEEESAAYYVPMLYYKGYAAVLETDGGETLPLTPEHGENGLIRLKTQNINHGVIRVYYKGTLIQKISDIVSLTALLLIPAAIFLSKRKRLTHEMV